MKNFGYPFINLLAIQKSVFSFLNPPEAIRNLANPLATPRSNRQFFFNPNGHTTVCQIEVFFPSQFASKCQRPYHGLTDRIFLTPVAIPLSVRQSFFFDNLDWDVNDHTSVSQTGSVVWSLTSQVKKGIKENPDLSDRGVAIDVLVKNDYRKKPSPRDPGMVTAGPGQKPECWRPLSIKLPLID